MKHIFIINPNAGHGKALDEIKGKLEAIGALESSEIHLTAGPGEATEFVKARAAEEPNETLRFYACGGDGTINEVASGVAECPNAELSCYPCGSGNDYVKIYGGKEAFMDMKALMEAEAQPIDLMKVCGRYCVNVCNFGFDTVVARTASDALRNGMAAEKAYKYAVNKALAVAMDNEGKIWADGKLLNESGRFLLCTVACGQYVGGSFKCAPRSENNDGLMEVCMFHTLSKVNLFAKLRFLTVKGPYEKGEHLDSKRCQKVLEYARAKSVTVKAPEGFAISVDGEIVETNDFTIEILPSAIKFAAPVKVPAMV